MDPQYFTHTLTAYEAELFVRGLQRRRQSLWEVARYLGFYSAAPHCKDFSFSMMGLFPWEKNEEPEEEKSEEDKMREIQELRALARIRDAELLNKSDNGSR